MDTLRFKYVYLPNQCLNNTINKCQSEVGWIQGCAVESETRSQGFPIAVAMAIARVTG